MGYKNSGKTEKDKGDSLFDITRSRMYTALNAFYIWKWMNQAINVHSNGGKKEAEKNVEIINKHRYFLHQVIVSCYKSFVADLAIFFDAEKYENSLSLGKLVGLLEGRLSDEEMEILKEEIEEIKNKHGVSIAQILKLRNAEVAHQSLEVEENTIKYGDIEELFAGVQEILNLISRHYDRSVSSWDHVEEDVSRDLQLVFSNLERGEKVRLDEINKKWGTE